MANDRPFSTEKALAKFLKPRTFLETASFANLIVAELGSAKLKKLKRDLKAKAAYLMQTAEIHQSKKSCEVLAEQCADLHVSLCFAEARNYRRGDKSDERARYDLKGIATEAELEKSVENAKKILGTRIISPRLIRAAKDKMAANSRLLPRFSKNNEYFSPPALVAAARKTFGGEIGLDPSSNPTAQAYIKARRWISAAENGLEADWGKPTSIWMNPPYNGRYKGKGVLQSFVEKFAAQECPRITLLNNNTECKWAQLLLSKAVAACWPKGRIHFHDSGGKRAQSAIQGSMILGLGVCPVDFTENFQPFGATKWLI